MVFKINLSTSDGKTFKVESESESLVGKKLHENVQGNDISPDLSGYEFEITGASDKAGFTSMKEVEGIGLSKLLLSYEKGMKKRPKKEGKGKRSKNRPKGLRLRKTVRGNTISEDIVQINLKVLKEGGKKLSEVFPEQNKGKEEAKVEEAPKEEVKKEEVSKDDNQKQIQDNEKAKELTVDKEPSESEVVNEEKEVKEEEKKEEKVEEKKD